MKKNIDVIAENSFIHEYSHHPYQIEHHLTQFLNSNDEEYHSILTLDTYVNILAPTPLRARKNSLISFLTIYCRLAIDLGLSVEKSFSVSDYFINEIERTDSSKELEVIYHDILYGYKHLLDKDRAGNYSLHIMKAIQYIHAHLYESPTLQDISDYLGINEHYFCTIFSKEVGVPPKKFIIQNKVKTAISLLSNKDLSISDIAELLKFTDTPHFIHTFKKATGLTPGAFRKQAHASF
ncbi:helix-turn-helix domain-containing protein [Enterococcus sp. DIV0756]|uniref:helix-turn-helix domain-containing protein n=1 Tax=Enterococcus sp. DIV0756 TaxID=2774636 RepID=UPI003F255308